MMKNLYYWNAIDELGNDYQGYYYAANSYQLKVNLSEKGLAYRKIKKSRHYFLNFIRYKHLKLTIQLLQQLSVMMKTGINITQAIKLIHQHINHNTVNMLLLQLQRDLNQGESLSQTMRCYPILFDEIIIHLLNSGELSGNLTSSLSQGAQYYQKKLDNINQVLTALLYPFVLSIISFVVLTIMIVFVIPQFETMYGQSNANLPPLTNLILSLSERIIDIGLYLPLFVIVIVVLFKALVPIKLIDLLAYSSIINNLYKPIVYLKLCQTLHELYLSGITISDCLYACKNLSTSKKYQHSITTTFAYLKQGDTLATALEKSGYYDTMLIQMIRTGEESANLAIMLSHCCDFYDDLTKRRFEKFKLLLEPILIICLGGLIGMIIIAMYLPIFQMGTQI